MDQPKQYEELDKRIIAAIESGHSPLYVYSCTTEAERLAQATGREGFRVIDARLQALRKQGRIQYLTKGKAPNGKPGWFLTKPADGSGA